MLFVLPVLRDVVNVNFSLLSLRSGGNRETLGEERERERERERKVRCWNHNLETEPSPTPPLLATKYNNNNNNTNQQQLHTVSEPFNTVKVCSPISSSGGRARNGGQVKLNSLVDGVCKLCFLSSNSGAAQNLGSNRF